MDAATLALALTAGMVSAVNPCGFAMLPAYLSVLVAADSGPGAVRRALACTAALTLGYVAVFGAVGLAVAPAVGWLQPRLPWLTVALGLGFVVVGGWLLAGGRLPGLRLGVKAPKLSRSLPSMVLFGMAYALASLSCTIAPFLAIVGSSLRAGSPFAGLGLFIAYAVGMGLVVGVAAIGMALVRASVVDRLRRAGAWVPRISGAVLAVVGAYVAYYGWYEVRLREDFRAAAGDPVVGAAAGVQRWLSATLSDVGAGWVAATLVTLVLLGALAGRMRRRMVDA
jgi:cytochrome c-type biogenesis protein